MSYHFADSLRAESGNSVPACEQDQDRNSSVLILLASFQQTCMIYTIAVKTPDDGQRNCPKHVEFYFKNKFEELVRLVGFIIRICHDARSNERQNLLAY